MKYKIVSILNFPGVSAPAVTDRPHYARSSPDWLRTNNSPASPSGCWGCSTSIAKLYELVNVHKCNSTNRSQHIEVPETEVTCWV